MPGEVERKKDIIIRGGENTSSREVEELQLTVAGVREAAAIGAPDARLCATVEAPLHRNVKQAYLENDERGSVLIFRSLKNTTRVGRSAVSEEVARCLAIPGATFDDVKELVAGVAGHEMLETGDLSKGVFWADAVGLAKVVEGLTAIGIEPNKPLAEKAASGGSFRRSYARFAPGKKSRRHFREKCRRMGGFSIVCGFGLRIQHRFGGQYGTKRQGQHRDAARYGFKGLRFDFGNHDGFLRTDQL